MSYKVKDYMQKTFKTVDEEKTVRAASADIGEEDEGFLIVTQAGSPKGVITAMDVVTKVVAERKDPEKVKVRDVMSSPLISVEPNSDLLEAFELMGKNIINRLAVINDGIIYGIVTTRDIAQHCGDYANKAVKDMLRWSSVV